MWGTINFVIYAVLAEILAKNFFPFANSLVATVWILAAFSSALIMRPLGSIIFGYIGDQFGRKDALIFSTFLSSIPMLIMGCMPCYESIGVFSPCLAILCFMIQGIAFGGEYNGAAIFTLEHLAKSKSRLSAGFVGGMISASSSIGVLFAILSGTCVASFPEISWGWRIPFIAGSFIGFLGVYIRFKMDETPEFEKISSSTHKKYSFLYIVQNYAKSCWVTFSIGAFMGIITYTSIGFLNMYLHQYLKIPLGQSLTFNAISSLIWVIGCPFFGYMSDFINKRAYFITALLGIFIIIPIVFQLFQTKDPSMIIVGQILFGLICSSVAGPSHGFMQKLFPPEVRYTGIAVNYCLGGALFGGITPIILSFFIDTTGNMNAPVFFIYICTAFLMISIINLGEPSNRLKKFDEFRKNI